jgi:hypothetical protein
MHDDSRHISSGSPNSEPCSNDAEERVKPEPVHPAGEPLVITITEAAPGRHEARHGQVLLCRSTVDETNIRFARWKPRLSQIGQTSIAPLRRSASPLAAGPFHRSGRARA